jgi:hypothetical protein
MIKMKRKGVSTVVSYVLIILLAVVGVSVLLGAYIKNVQKGTSGDSSSCFGIDLEVKSCNVISPAVLQDQGLSDTNPAIIMNVERYPGGGNIQSLRFVVTDSSGKVHIEKPTDLILSDLGINVNTDYSDFFEYGSDFAIVRNIDYGVVTYVDVTVSAVVGKSETICAPTRPVIRCA